MDRELNGTELEEIAGGRAYDYKVYTVQKGETAKSISQKLNRNKILLMQLNNITDENQVLSEGRQLLVAT